MSAEIRNRFLIPLGLNHTFFAVEEDPVGEIAHGWYDIDDDGIPDEGIHFTVMLNEANGECFWAIMEAVGDVIMNN